VSSSRSFRRKLQASREARQSRKGIAMTSTPAVGTTRRWLKAAEAAGLVRRAEDQDTGRPGRPAHMWELTEEGREQAKRTPPLEVMLEQVRRRENARLRGARP
jgi:predicted ArsR family transcriptional regulator